MRRFFAIGLLLSSQAILSALSVDATREQVIAELGKPQSVASLGGREILLYPNGVRLELVGGRIVSAEGLTLGASEPPRVEPPLPEPTENADSIVSVPDDELDIVESDMAGREYTAVGGLSQAELEKSFDALVASREQATGTPLLPSFNAIEFALKLVLMFLLTVAALKLSCKYWGAEVFWSGILIVSAVDALIRGGMALAGRLLWELPTLFYLDEAMAGIVMVLLLKKLSINQSTAQAVELTMTTKIFTIVVGAFLVSMILQGLH